MKKEISKNRNFLLKFFRVLILIFPAAMYFSYFPVISFGANESMNFELSLALIWLVVFDFVAFLLLIQEKRFGLFFRKKWLYLLFPVFTTLSLLWSQNLVRGILTVGILWLIYFAVMSVVVFRDKIDDKSRKSFWRWFFISSLLVCAWCILQCVLDVMGVSRDCTLLCRGCVSAMFSFPHPNGFAIEPQFMGNLLLAPSIAVGAFYVFSRAASDRPVATGGRRLPSACQLPESLEKTIKYPLVLFFVFTATLFLTFSRGAIYAFIVAMIFMTVYYIVQTKKWRVMILWPVIALAFLFTLNLQGIFAEVGPTNETYFGGIAKALNHLSLGVIDIRNKNEDNSATSDNLYGVNEGSEIVDEKSQEESVFDGYVAESTEVRKEMTRKGLTVWKRDVKTMLFGVGIGGAGEAMYEMGLIDNPKEIVQNQYVSILVEVGLVGVAIAAVTIIMILAKIFKYNNITVLTLMVAYAVTLVFFSGLANALQIYLMPAVLFAILDKKN